MLIEQYLGWVANVFFILGVYILGNKNVNGFYLNAIANFLYIIQAIYMHNTALLWLSIGLIFLNLKGVYEWRKHDKMGN